MAGPDSSLYDSIQSSAVVCSAVLGFLTASARGKRSSGSVGTHRARGSSRSRWGKVRALMTH